MDHNKNISMKINTVKYSPVAASSYMDLPPKLRFSRGLLNIQNEDNECFLWSILAALPPVQMHPERVSNYIQYEDTLNFLKTLTIMFVCVTQKTAGIFNHTVMGTVFIGQI
jgi:hypothetical protein